MSEIKRSIYGRAIEWLTLNQGVAPSSDTQRSALRRVIEHICDVENPLLNAMERESLIESILDDMLGCGPLERLLRDSRVEEILVVAPDQVWVRRGDRRERSDVTFDDQEHLRQTMERIRSRYNFPGSASALSVQGELAPGTHLLAIVPPSRILASPMVLITRTSVPCHRPPAAEQPPLDAQSDPWFPHRSNICNLLISKLVQVGVFDLKVLPPQRLQEIVASLTREYLEDNQIPLNETEQAELVAAVLSGMTL